LTLQAFLLKIGTLVTADLENIHTNFLYGFLFSSKKPIRDRQKDRRMDGHEPYCHTVAY